MLACTSFQDDRECVVCVLMTTACAVSKFVDGIKYLRWVFGLRVVVRLVVVGMTSCAVRCVDGGFPGDDLGIRDMTILAPHISGVSAREERRAVTVSDNGCPTGRGVTGVTRA